MEERMGFYINFFYGSVNVRGVVVLIRNGLDIVF